MSNDNIIENIASKVVSIIILIIAVIVLFNVLLSKTSRFVPQKEQANNIQFIEVAEDDEEKPQTAFLSIYSIPGEAEVWLEDKLIGVTPLQLPKLSTTRTYDITLKHPLTQPDTFSIDLEAGAIKKEVRELTYEKGDLILTSTPVGAKIFIDNKYTGKITPSTLKLLAGKHTVKLRLDDYASYGNSEHLINVKPKTANPLDIKLSPLYSININVNPAAQISIKHIDKDYFSHMRLPEGEYTIEARKKGYETLIKTVFLDNNKSFNFNLSLKKTALNISTYPENSHVVIDGQGQYKPGMKLNAGKYTISVQAKGFWDKSFRLKLNEDKNIHIALDSKFAPKMLHTKKGSFYMGGNGEFNRPIHSRKINSFYVSKTEITHQQWQQCVLDKACRSLTNNKIDPNMPAMSMSWHEAKSFINWLNSKGDAKYRLLSEAEWEYIAHNQGEKIGLSKVCQYENFQAKAKKEKDRSVYKIYVEEEKYDCPYPSGKPLITASLNPNQFGVYDILGNVQEWVEDCWHADYRFTKNDSAPWLDEAYGDCSLRVVRGGSYQTVYEKGVGQKRSFSDADRINPNIGFRIARDTENFRL